MMLWLTVLLAIPGQLRSEEKRYCNKVFDLLDRSDESEGRCRWLERETFSTSQLGECEGGVECEGECIPWSDWCSPHLGSTTVLKCGALISSPRICQNKTFWASKPCQPSSRRCTGWWPGECSSQTGDCRDRSGEAVTAKTSGYCIQDGDRLVNATPSMFQCHASHHTTPICAVRCDRRLDGCLEDEDETDCLASSHNLTLVLVLIPVLILTLLTIETVVQAVNTAKIDQENLGQGGQGGPLVVEMEEVDSDLAQHLAEFSRIILDQENWDLGTRDDSNIFKPTYPEKPGEGFNGEKLDKIKQLYKSIKKSKSPDLSPDPSQSSSPLHYIIYTIQNDQRLKDHQISSALKHYAHCLIYNILEREYQELQGYSQPTDLDVSIMKQLTTRHAGDFYGHVFPYFDPIGSLKILLGVENIIKKINDFISRIPHGPDLKYLLIVTLSVLTWYIDFIKDILIAIDLSFLYNKSVWDFKSQIVVILWVTVFLGQTITGVYILVKFWTKPSQIFGSGLNGFSSGYRMLARLAFILLAPVSPAILIYVNKRRERELRKNEKKLMALDETNIIERLRLFKERQKLIGEKEKIEGFLIRSYKIENVLENTPQLLVQLLIVLMSATTLLHLPEVTGIQAVFDDHISDNFLSSAFFYISIGWSLQSICIGHISTYLMKKKNNLPDLGKVLAFLLYFIGCTARIIAIVFFFTPALGLFNIMLPYSIDQRINYSSSVGEEIGEKELSDMRDIGWYYLTSSRPNNCLMVFSLLPLVHLIIMMTFRGFLKELSGLDVKKTFTIILHSLSSLLVPEIYRDWDSEARFGQNYYSGEWGRVKREYKYLIIIYSLENILLSLPLLYTCSRLMYRHTLVTPLDMELSSLTWAYITIFLTPVFFTLIAIIQYNLFVYYNKVGHTWARLLPKEESVQKSSKPQEETTIIPHMVC